MSISTINGLVGSSSEKMAGTPIIRSYQLGIPGSFSGLLCELLAPGRPERES